MDLYHHPTDHLPSAHRPEQHQQLSLELVVVPPSEVVASAVVFSPPEAELSPHPSDM